MSDDENEAVCVFRIGPGGGDPLSLAHEAEAARLGVKFTNYGWVSGENCICSKTDKGYLETEWDAQSQQWRHSFQQWRWLHTVGVVNTPQRQESPKRIRSTEEIKRIDQKTDNVVPFPQRPQLPRRR